MKRILLLSTMLYSMPAAANTYDWFYNDGIDAGMGSVVTTTDDGAQLITSIFGEANGSTIVGLAPPGTINGNDNLLFPNSIPLLDGSGFGFFTADGNIVDIDLSFTPPPLFYQFDTLTPAGLCAPCTAGPDSFGVINTTPIVPPIMPPIIPPMVPVPAPVVGNLFTLLRLFLPAQYRDDGFDRWQRDFQQNSDRDRIQTEQRRMEDEMRWRQNQQQNQMEQLRTDQLKMQDRLRNEMR